MDINDLHAVRDGGSPRRRRTFNPFIHLSPDTPLMRVLFAITRPSNFKETKPAKHHIVRKKVVRATHLPGGSMVAYAKERRNLEKPS